MLALVLALALAGCGGSGSETAEPETAPAAQATPSFVHLQSDPGDAIGQGRSYTYTATTADIAVRVVDGRLAVSVGGSEAWSGEFLLQDAPSGKLQPGHHGKAWRVDGGRRCGAAQGWFSIDQATYSGSDLAALDLRFEQRCDGQKAALRGQVHWTAPVATATATAAVAAGPINPPPADLWQPAPGTLPATGNYVYLQSDPGDHIGQGLTRIYTPAGTTFSVTGNGGRLRVALNGAQYWYGDFQAMSALTQLQPGYYGDLPRYPFHNPVKGGLDWWGDGRGCNTLQGWFVVDHVAYSAGTLSAIDLRFEQHCEGGKPALHGQVHWVAGS